ncbi:ammonium transporter 2-like [Euwallacea fornicatus]|uniref:ammonium transporter 2-like n=1 Tax=Euwallacea fornicatus TaxID=995702 RepID=UPI00338E71DB
MAYFEPPEFGKYTELTNALGYLNETTAQLVNNNDIWAGDSTTSVVRIVCAVLLRIGFVLIQMGNIPAENAYTTIFRNIFEMATSVAAYGFLGYYFSFGKKTIYGFLNYGGHVGGQNAELSFAALGFSACLLGTAISSSILVAHLHQFPILIIAFLTSGIFLPILMCWCWSKHGWMTGIKLINQRVSIKDYGANLVVHVPSATIGLVGVLFLKTRILKLKDVDRKSLGNEYSSGIVTGYLFVIIGHFGLYLPYTDCESPHALMDYISYVSINSIMATGAGVLVVILVMVVLTRDLYRYWIIARGLQGGLAGLVTVAAGIDVYSHLVSFGIASGGSMIFFFASNLIHYSPLENCFDIIIIYLVCASIGLLLPPLLNSRENLGLTIPLSIQSINLLWQFLCLIVIFLLTVIIFLSLFTLLYVSGIFKTFENENHQRVHLLYRKLSWTVKKIPPESN